MHKKVHFNKKITKQKTRKVTSTHCIAQKLLIINFNSKKIEEWWSCIKNKIQYTAQNFVIHYHC